MCEPDCSEIQTRSAGDRPIPKIRDWLAVKDSDDESFDRNEAYDDHHDAASSLHRLCCKDSDILQNDRKFDQVDSKVVKYDTRVEVLKE